MVEMFFLKVLNLSITASWLVLALMLFRIVFRKAPKAIHAALWALVGIRLICPFSLESMFSLVPSAETIPQNIMYAQTPTIHSGVAILNSTINPILENNFSPEVEASVNPLQVVSFVLSHLWIAGMLAMLLYAGISYWKIKKKVREALPVDRNIYGCDQVESPFILGVVRPRIYLPANLPEEEQKYVLAHENAHIARRDHWWKPLGFFLLTIYWFNPVLWIAYVLLCRDIELACDEKVIANLGIEVKKPYSMALLNCSVSRRSVSACPLAFGEVNVKNRIKSVLNYKKPAFWIIMIAILFSCALAVAFLTNPVSRDVDRIVKEKGYHIVEQIPYEFTATIPKDVLTEAAFTKEGQRFKKDEVIVYATESTNVYLEHVLLSNGSEEWIDLIFNFSYHDLDRQDSVILPYKISEKGYTFTINMKTEELADGMVIYDRAVSIRGHGPEEKFTVCADAKIVKNALRYMAVKLVANELVYSKTPAFSIRENAKLDESLESFLDKEVMNYFETEHSAGNFRFADIEVLEAETRGNQITVYAWVLYEEYSYQNGPVREAGAHIPVAITAEKISDYYELVEFWQPKDGNEYLESLKQKFPEKLQGKELDSQNYIDRQREKSEEAVSSFYATNISGKVYRGEAVVYGNRVVDSFIYFTETIPKFVLVKESLHLLTNDFPEPSILSSYYDIGQIQKIELSASIFDHKLDDEFNPWERGYSAEELRRNNKNAYLVTEEGQEYNRFYYILEQKNGDVYIAFGWEGEGIRYIFKMSVSEESIEAGDSSVTYVCKNKKEWDYATLTLDTSKQTFTYSESPIMSYFGFGTYRIEGNQLILETEDGMYTYVFDIYGDELYYEGNVYKKLEPMETYSSIWSANLAPS